MRMTPVQRSAETMARAAVFLATGAMGPPNASMLANSLRELDRFLSLLIDAVALDALPAAFDHAAFARQSHTPNKLRHVHHVLGLSSPDHDRLCAIGRARERLFHAARHTRWQAPLPGERVLIGDLRAICALYGRIAQALAAACEDRDALH